MGLSAGDLIFYSKKHNRRYLSITHVAIVRDFTLHPGYLIIESTNESDAVPYAVRYSSWEHSGKNIVAVCRPFDQSAISGNRKNTFMKTKQENPIRHAETFTVSSSL
jgi:hypothetical protein